MYVKKTKKNKLIVFYVPCYVINAFSQHQASNDSKEQKFLEKNYAYLIFPFFFLIFEQLLEALNLFITLQTITE